MSKRWPAKRDAHRPTSLSVSSTAPATKRSIAELRAIGCGVALIPDGDVAGVIATTNPETNVDIYMGSGGAPEGVLAAAALRCVGGQFKGRLLFRNDDERLRAKKWGIEDLDRVYDLEDLAKGDVIFAATGVTDGSLTARRQAPARRHFDHRNGRDARIVGHRALGEGRTSPRLRMPCHPKAGSGL